MGDPRETTEVITETESPTDSGSTDSESTNDGELSRDTIFRTLSNRRRRLLLRYLSKNGVDRDTVRLRDLAEWIAAAENDVPIEEVTYKQRKRVYTSLYQSHLPALHRDGIIEYDRARGTIVLTPIATTFDTYLGFVPKTDPLWCVYWLGLGASSVAISVLSWLGVVPVLPSGPLLAVVLSLVVFASAIAFARAGSYSQR